MINSLIKKILKKTPFYAFYRQLKERRDYPIYQKSYSQCGEDLIMYFLFNWLKIRRPIYLDIGANHPKFLNNTYFFYKRGCSGILIEPNHNLLEKLRRVRPRDKCINIGIGFGEKREADFYIMTADTMSTFSKETAEQYASYGTHKIKEVRKVLLVPINEIFPELFEKTPNLISLDIEGLDLDILKSINFEIYRPEVFCVETLTYSEDNTEKKLGEIIDFMLSQDYFVYADTYVNTIFVDKRCWEKRKSSIR